MPRSGNTDGVIVWEAATGRVRHRYGGPQVGQSIAFSSDGSLFATGGDRLRTWETASGRLRAEAAKGHVAWVVWSPDGKALAAAGPFAAEGAPITLWDASLGKTVQSWSVNGYSPRLAWSPDSKWLSATTNGFTYF